MDFTTLLDQLNQASLFELYRLNVAIRNELENPNRLTVLKERLRIGMEIDYFDPQENRPVSATLLELRQKTVLVLDKEQQKRFVIPYYMLNIDGLDTTIHDNKEALTANNLSVGDCVGFNKDGHDIVGTVQRLNQKTVTLKTNDDHTWRVAYCFLYRVHNATTGEAQVLIRG